METAVREHMEDIFSPHHGGRYTPAMEPISTTTINETALPASTTLGRSFAQVG